MRNSAIWSLVLVLGVLTGGCDNGPDTTGPSEEATPVAENLITNSIGMKLVLIPAGEFMMGSPESAEELAKVFEKDPRYFRDVHPYHRVRITKAFYLGVYEVTQAEYEQVMGTNPSEFKGDPQRPVEEVSWDDAVEFCRRLSRQEGKTYRLPTEAEWEYACRAGSTTRWCFGDSESELSNYAWYDDNSGLTIHPVGQKKPNGWGLYDMHGNVYEWCQDGYDRDYYKNSPTDDPSGATTRSSRVIRGGGWFNYSCDCRSAYGYGRAPDVRRGFLGFRVALVPVDASGR